MWDVYRANRSSLDIEGVKYLKLRCLRVRIDNKAHQPAIALGRRWLQCDEYKLAANHVGAE